MTASVTFSELCRFTDKQRLATSTADTHRYTLFGGSRGPGKSFFVRWYLVRRLMRWAAQGHCNVRVMLACEDYPSLYERQISKVQTEFPAWLGTYHVQRNEYRLDSAYGGGAIAFRNLDDASKYQSAEYAGIAIDELTKNTERTFHLLRGSLRWPGIDDVFFVGATNPAPGFVRDWWISRQFPDNLQPEAKEFAFVPALPTDNPNLPQSYWSMLDTLPDVLRRAWKDGDWFVATEGLVYDTFTADNLTDEEPDPARPIELAIDDGYVDPRAILFIQQLPGGDVLVFDEIYDLKKLEEQSIKNILAKWAGYFGKDIPDEWQRFDVEQCAKWCAEQGIRLPEIAAVSHEAPALRERLRRANIVARNWLAAPLLPGESKSGKRVAAIKRTRALICDGQGHRAIKINRRCKHTLDEIMAGYKYPEGKKSSVDDMPADDNDHCCQALESWVYLRKRR